MALPRRSFLSLATRCVAAFPLVLPLLLAAPRKLLAQRGTPRIQQSVSGKSIRLSELLERGLRARRPEEFAFIRRVTRLVQLNQLPKDLVQSTFNWAKRKRPYPFPYFERALKARAARQGIRI